MCDARLTVLPPFAQVLITGLHNLEVNMHEVRAPPQSFACVMLFDDRDASSRARAAARATRGWKRAGLSGVLPLAVVPFAGKQGRPFGSTRK